MSKEAQEGEYVISIEGLAVSRSFSVGPVTIFNSITAIPFATEVNWSNEFESRLLPSEGHSGAAAYVHANSTGEAISMIRQALENLRVFQDGLTRSAHYTHFGLPGEISSSSIFYLRHDNAGTGGGFTTSGLHLGYELGDVGIESWEQAAPTLQFAASAIGNADSTAGANRALNGIRHFSRSILAQEPDLRVLLIIAGLESMLSKNEQAPGRFSLARYLSYLSCWRVGSCGKSNKEPCPYLVLDPREPKDFKLIKRLEWLMEKDNTWACTYWKMVNTWHETRSGFAHGNSYETDPDESRRFAYWAYHQYFAPVLDWILAHPEDPAGSLDEALNGLSATVIDWREIVRDGDREKLIFTLEAQINGV